MVEFGKEFDAEDKNWKRFWEILVERNDAWYDGDAAIRIYQDISGLDIDEAVDELSRHFDDLLCDNNLFNEKINYFDKEKSCAELTHSSKKFIKNYLITVQYFDDMCSDNIFEDGFKITIANINTRREEFAKEAANKFSSVEDFARWVYDNSFQLEAYKLF